MKRSRKILIASAGTGIVALSVAGYCHFKDDAPPDLSRFPKQSYDEAAYADYRRRADDFTTRYVAFKPKKPDDIDEEAIDDTNALIVPRALRGDPVARRCLSRKIRENKDAIEAASRLVGSYRRSEYDMTRPDTISTPVTMSQERQAVNLLLDYAAWQAADGRPDEAIRTIDGIVAGTGDRRALGTTLIDYLISAAIDRKIESLLVRIIHVDTDRTRIERTARIMDKTAPEPKLLERGITGEVAFLQNVLTNHTNLAIKALGEADEPSAGVVAKIDAYWIRANILPNATLRDYGDTIETFIRTHQGSLNDASKLEKPHRFQRNYGGKLILNTVAVSVAPTLAVQKRSLAAHDLARVAIAVRLYQLSNNGKNPAALADLAPAYLPEIPVDPFDGKPMRYDPKTGRAWSVGEDLKVDGGDPEKDIILN